jgi:hypothetical protein
MADDDYLPQGRIPDDLTVDIAMYIERQAGCSRSTRGPTGSPERPQHLNRQQPGRGDQQER